MIALIFFIFFAHKTVASTTTEHDFKQNLQEFTSYCTPLREAQVLPLVDDDKDSRLGHLLYQHLVNGQSEDELKEAFGNEASTFEVMSQKLSNILHQDSNQNDPEKKTEAELFLEVLEMGEVETPELATYSISRHVRQKNFPCYFLVLFTENIPPLELTDFMVKLSSSVRLNYLKVRSTAKSTLFVRFDFVWRWNSSGKSPALPFLSSNLHESPIFSPKNMKESILKDHLNELLHVLRGVPVMRELRECVSEEKEDLTSLGFELVQAVRSNIETAEAIGEPIQPITLSQNLLTLYKEELSGYRQLKDFNFKKIWGSTANNLIFYYYDKYASPRLGFIDDMELDAFCNAQWVVSGIFWRGPESFSGMFDGKLYTVRRFAEYVASDESCMITVYTNPIQATAHLLDYHDGFFYDEIKKGKFVDIKTQANQYAIICIIRLLEKILGVTQIDLLPLQDIKGNMEPYESLRKTLGAAKEPWIGTMEVFCLNLREFLPETFRHILLEEPLKINCSANQEDLVDVARRIRSDLSQAVRDFDEILVAVVNSNEYNEQKEQWILPFPVHFSVIGSLEKRYEYWLVQKYDSDQDEQHTAVYLRLDALNRYQLDEDTLFNFLPTLDDKKNLQAPLNAQQRADLRKTEHDAIKTSNLAAIATILQSMLGSSFFQDELEREWVAENDLKHSFKVLQALNMTNPEPRCVKHESFKAIWDEVAEAFRKLHDYYRSSVGGRDSSEHFPLLTLFLHSASFPGNNETLATFLEKFQVDENPETFPDTIIAVCRSKDINIRDEHEQDDDDDIFEGCLPEILSTKIPSAEYEREGCVNVSWYNSMVCHYKLKINKTENEAHEERASLKNTIRPISKQDPSLTSNVPLTSKTSIDAKKKQGNTRRSKSKWILPVLVIVAVLAACFIGFYYLWWKPKNNQTQEAT